METKHKLEQLLLNDLVYFSKLKDELWQYHPANPCKIDIVGQYDNALKKIGELKDKIKSI